MNEPSNFCPWPCDNPEEQQETTDLTKTGGLSPRQDQRLAPRQYQSEPKRGLLNRNLIDPSYKIANTFGSLSNKTANTDLIHQGGWTEYDTHNL